MKYLGTKVGNGYGLGKCLIINEDVKIDSYVIKENEAEIFLNTLTKTVKDYEELISKTEIKDLKELLEFNKTILLGESLKVTILNDIKSGISAPKAIEDYFANKIQELEKVDNAYLKERAKDLKDAANKLIKNFLGIDSFESKKLTEDVILVSKEIMPSILLSEDLTHVKGIVSELGGRTSHVGILSISLGIPSVFGIQNIDILVKNGEHLFIDGNKGYVQNKLTEQDVNSAKILIQKDLELKEDLKTMNNKKAITEDGKEFEVAINTGDLSELDTLGNLDFDGIGLFRSEFLFLNKSEPPKEDYLFEVYKSFATKLNNKPIIIRTLDIGGDKKCSYIDIPLEANPFLGYRAIRYCLKNKEFFKTSLRAILRASMYGNIKIMYPMISSIEEIREANAILYEAKEELRIQGIHYNDNIKVGIMVEVPSTAEMADLLIDEVDFFSIGTNDLVQYTVAVDRVNPTVSYLYNWFNPGVLRLIKKTIDATKGKEPKFTGMCGEMASDPLGIILLVGMGLQEFSVSTTSVLKTKKLISLLNYEECMKIVEQVMKYKSAKEIEITLENYARLKYGKYY